MSAPQGDKADNKAAGPSGTNASEGDKAKTAGVGGEEGKRKLPQLGALEDDDEFEEFAPSDSQSGNIIDALKKDGANGTGGPGDQLWEMNWDDDDVDDDFTKQLRTAIAERNGAADEAMKD